MERESHVAVGWSSNWMASSLICFWRQQKLTDWENYWWLSETGLSHVILQLALCAAVTLPGLTLYIMYTFWRVLLTVVLWVPPKKQQVHNWRTRNSSMRISLHFEKRYIYAKKSMKSASKPTGHINHMLLFFWFQFCIFFFKKKLFQCCAYRLQIKVDLSSLCLICLGAEFYCLSPFWPKAKNDVPVVLKPHQWRACKSLILSYP